MQVHCHGSGCPFPSIEFLLMSSHVSCWSLCLPDRSVRQYGTHVVMAKCLNSTLQPVAKYYTLHYKTRGLPLAQLSSVIVCVKQTQSKRIQS